MQFVNAFNEALESWNILETPTEKLDDYFRDNPNLYKVVLIVNHIFRALAISFMMFSPLSIAICFVGSLLYRITVEKNCAFKFALPSFAGGLSFIEPPLLALYFSYVILTVSYEVDNRPGTCCL